MRQPVFKDYEITGKEPSSQVVSCKAHSNPRVDRLGIDKTEHHHSDGAIRYADGICRLWKWLPFPEKFIKNFNRREVTSHFFQTLERHGYKIGKSHPDHLCDWPKIDCGLFANFERTGYLGLTQVSYFEGRTALRVCEKPVCRRTVQFYLENN